LLASIDRWQTAHCTPSLSLSFKADPLPGVVRDSTHADGVWQRRQKAPTPGRSCSATVSDARYIGSRAAFAIIDPAQVSQGMYILLSSVLKPPWHDLQPFAVSISDPFASPPGGVPAPAAGRAPASATMNMKTNPPRRFT